MRQTTKDIEIRNLRNQLHRTQQALGELRSHLEPWNVAGRWSQAKAKGERAHEVKPLSAGDIDDWWTSHVKTAIERSKFVESGSDVTTLEVPSEVYRDFRAMVEATIEKPKGGETRDDWIDGLQKTGTALVIKNRALLAELEQRRTLMQEPFRMLDRRGPDVIQFFGHIGQGADLGATPHVPPEDSIRAGIKLVAEEFVELVGATFEVWWRPGAPSEDTLDELLGRLLWYVEDAPIDLHLPRAMAESVDVDYAIEGLRRRCGVNGGPIWDGIHQANMRKEPGAVDGKGKLGRKPEGWEPFDVGAELRAQGWVPAKDPT